VKDKTAELLALRAGFHPFEIWPELAEDRLEEVKVACESCEAMFVPVRKGHRFCTERCRHRAHQRRWFREKYHSDPAFREAKKAQVRREREQPPSAAVVRARRVKQALRYAANAEQYRATNRAWYAANREAFNAKRRERYAARKAA
jgi:hypothetical protein